jgi:hypothetical protein
LRTRGDPALLAEVLRSYRVTTVRGDRYGGEWPRERFRAHGIEYQFADKTKSEIYGATLPLINSGRVDLLDLPKLLAQFVGLERRTARGGRDSIDHGPSAHDDVSNSVAGALELLIQITPGWGILEHYRRESEKARSAQQDEAHPAAIRLRVPAGVSSVNTMSGRSVPVGPDGTINISDGDAKPLIGMGWPRVEPERIEAA